MKKAKLLIGVFGVSAALPAAAGFDFDLGNGDKISFGGYIKVDARYVDGDVNYQDYWRGNNPGFGDESHFGINVRETRFNSKYTHGDVTGFIEMDFYGGGGNEVATNSSNPRLRHAMIQYKNILAGQYWSTFMPLAALPDALDFAGPIVGEVFVRQPQIRYTNGGLKIALENPDSWGGSANDTLDQPSSGAGTVSNEPDGSPDVVVSYTVKGDWGEVTVAGLVRKVEDTVAGEDLDETAVAGNVSGKIMLGKDDIRFQANFGESGRYVGAVITTDYVQDSDGEWVVEETTAFTLSYRHIWNDDWRSSVYYGYAETDVLEYERSHWGLNLIRQLTPQLSAGAEIGQFSIDDGNGAENGDSDYLQFSMKFAL